MRISDWSSDVCSSDLLRRGGQQGQRNPDEFLQAADVLHRGGRQIGPGARAHGALGPAGDALIDRLRPRHRKSVVTGKSVSVRVALGGRRIINNTTHKRTTTTPTRIPLYTLTET